MSVALAVGAASAYGAYMNSQAQSDANRSNVKMAREQMAFQEKMSSTAHQRQVSDLRAAGLNPMLSVNAGASAPTGASTTVQSTRPGDALSEGMSSAMEVKRIKQADRAQDTQIKATESSIGLNDATKEKMVEEKAVLQSVNRKNTFEVKNNQKIFDINEPILRAKAIAEQANAKASTFEAEARIRESAARIQDAEFSRKNRSMDNRHQDTIWKARKLNEGLGIINNAKDALNPLKGLLGGRDGNSRRSTGYTQENFDGAGEVRGGYTRRYNYND